MLFWGDYYLRWWRLPIEERACRKTDLGCGDYYLRNSGLPPSLRVHKNSVTLIMSNAQIDYNVVWKSILTRAI